MLLKDIQNSYCSGNTRACRTRRPICYTFGKYVLYVDYTASASYNLTPTNSDAQDNCCTAC